MPDLDIPILDLTHPLSEGGDAIGLPLMAYLTWPSDKTRREQYLATLEQDSVSHLQHLPLPKNVRLRYPEVSENLLNQHWSDSKSQVVEKIVRENLIASGRLGLVANAPALRSLLGETEKHVQGWHTAGHILFMIYIMDSFHRSELKPRGGASVNKAVEQIEAKQPKGLPKNRKDIMRLWSAYQPVAHIATALLIMSSAFDGNIKAMITEIFFRNPGTTLAIAKIFQEFGLVFHAHGRRESLLDAARLWKIPDSVSLPTPELRFSPLSADDIGQIMGYMAPKRL